LIHHQEWSMNGRVLTINAGSSSIKFACFSFSESPILTWSGKIERIGQADASISIKKGESVQREPIEARDHDSAVQALIQRLDRMEGAGDIAALGHRVVFGGPNFIEPHITDSKLTEALERLSPLDPEHLPLELALIQAFAKRLPDLPQVACFDTAFHHDLPRVAKQLPIPRRYETAGIRRYGFHGLSYAYLLEELAQKAGAEAARRRIILAHLGAGASMAAVRDGKCIDTTMAFTPTAGLVMATRTGDLDPGFLIYLMRKEGMGAEEINDLVNHRSGLLGISETSADVRDLLAREKSDPRAAEALALFCYQAKKWIGAFASLLGGLDTLVFAGGIGENAAEIRARICEGLEFLGIQLDSKNNAESAPVISAGKVAVRVIPTNEELMIAKLIWRLLGRTAESTATRSRAAASPSQKPERGTQ
jgi:acetate kinase